MGPKTFPYLVGGVALLCGFVFLFRPDPDPKWPAAKTWLWLALAAAVLVLYAYGLKPFGFLLPTAVVASVLSFQIGPRVVPAILTGCGLSVGLFVIFKYVLGLGLFAFPRALMGA